MVPHILYLGVNVESDSKEGVTVRVGCMKFRVQRIALWKGIPFEEEKKYVQNLLDHLNCSLKTEKEIRTRW